ncbi:MAG: cytochrome ubiquinol oxidase subunit I [Desulfobacterota bacterium]|nr:cytochrome ubiquinol oxidase subunit I [Thermodesulfobacteriota bacterium]
MYPIWEVPGWTSGMILAFMATFHVLPSHLLIGAMWFNVFVETKAYREKREDLLEFLKKYTLLLLVFSYVLGSLSGIGIWFAATVGSPRSISALIHTYVWGWATEWVFFIIEVVGIFVYYYTFGKVDRRTHLTIGWIFAIGSWITMVIIVGILAFMVSPGKLMETGNFFDGFFNQTYWPQLLMRTALMFSVSAVYAIAVATRVKNAEVRGWVTKTAAKWGLAGLILGAFLSLWYLKTLPEEARGLLSTAVSRGLKTGIAVPLGLLILYFIFVKIKPLTIRLIPALAMIAVMFGGIWSAERIREIVRKPYLIPQYMYSNQIIGHDIPAKGVKAETGRMDETGLLKISPFVPEDLREVKEENLLEAGRLIAMIQCTACHTLDEKGLRPMPQRIKNLGLDKEALGEFLEGLKQSPYMPPFFGTEREKQALAAYLASFIKE